MADSTILINVPRLNLPGGVTNFYRVLRQHLDGEYFEAGQSEGNTILRMLRDYWRFHRRLSKGVSLVHLNPSMNRKAVWRDMVFLLIAKAHRVPVLVFFHGWEISFCAKQGRLFRWVFNKADLIVVLASKYREQLERKGIRVPIHLGTVSVEDHEQADVSGSLRVLFLSRLIPGKGLSEAIAAVSRIPGATLTVAGDGPEIGESTDTVRFLGHVEGEAKCRAFMDANVYLFPSSLDEGMPTTVIEAMSYGLPVVTRVTGGLHDFFNEKMGLAAESTDPEVLAGLLRRMTPEVRADIGAYNHTYARENFSPAIVSKDIRRFQRGAMTLSEVPRESLLDRIRCRIFGYVGVE